jgi:hypothetical protein
MLKKQNSDSLLVRYNTNNNNNKIKAIKILKKIFAIIIFIAI